jgi:D-ala-D-ala dipeptidase
MPSGYDEMTDRAFADYAGGAPEERARRALLRRAMEKQDFKVNPKEWWHFDCQGLETVPNPQCEVRRSWTVDEVPKAQRRSALVNFGSVQRLISRS